MGNGARTWSRPRFLKMMGFGLFSVWRRSTACRVSAFASVLLTLLLAGAGTARASVALLLEMPYGELGAFNPTGHAALYFDHICAASPLELRPCAPGEAGVVISRYDGIGDYDWVAVPVIPYLYGVESPTDIPASMDRLTALRMRDLYRREHLERVAPDTPDGGMPQGNWYELVGSAFDRTIYGFQLDTTAQQDEELINYFNDRPNVTRYSGAFRNCADFTRTVLDRLYPRAVRRNYVADFGISTPKSVARNLVRYGRKHPELELRMFRVPQLQGTIPRSMSIQGVAGSLLTRYGVPMAILSPHVTAVVLAAYVGKGRFAVPKNAPVLEVADLQRGNEPHLLAGDSAKSVSTAGNLPSGADGVPSGLISMFPPEEGGYTGMDAAFDCSGSCEAVPFLP